MMAGIYRMFYRNFWSVGLENNRIFTNTDFYIYGNNFEIVLPAVMKRTGFAV